MSKKYIVFQSLFIIIIFGIALIGGTILYNKADLLTGLAISDIEIDNEDEVVGLSTEDKTPVTREKAVRALETAEEAVGEGNGKQIYDDLLIEAANCLQAADLAEVAESSDSTFIEKNNARKALALVGKQGKTYECVKEKSEEIKKLKEKEKELLDKQTILINKIVSDDKRDDIRKGNYKNVLLSPTETPIEDEDVFLLYSAIEDSLSAGRIEEAEQLMNEMDILLETKKAEESALNSLVRNSKTYIEQYWIFFVLFLIIFFILSYFIFRIGRRAYYSSNLNKLENEQYVLQNLMKKAQSERYKDNKISGFVYNIRMEKYKERMNEIKGKIPVFESRLRKTKKKLDKKEKKKKTFKKNKKTKVSEKTKNWRTKRKNSKNK